MGKFDEVEDSAPPPIGPEDFPPGSTVEPPKKKPNGEFPHTEDEIAEGELPLPEAFSEEALTHAWVEQHSQDWRYVDELDRWFRWTGNVWEHERKREYFFLSRNICRQALAWPEAAALTPAGKRALGRASTAAAIISNLRSQPEIALHAEDLDADPFLLATPEGVIDLKVGKLIPASREAYCTKCSAVAPLRGPAPLWEGVVNRAARSDAGMLSYLQRWAGYFLTGDTREEGLMFVHGPGGSGKSTFVRVLSEILGTYSRACNMDAFTNRDRSEHSTEIAKLAGARLVTATETDAGAKWNEPRIKQLTGRDKIAARFMRQDEFEFMPSFKIIIAGNHRPGLKTVGEEMRRRIHLIEFPESLSLDERNNQLPDQLRAEYPAILQWMIDGCLEWQSQGLGKPERVIEDTEQYLQAQDVLGAWISEALEHLPGSSTRVSECHRSYTNFAKDRGEFEPSMTRFSEDMQARGWTTFKSSVMFFKDCSLKSPVTHVPDYMAK